MKLFQRWKKQGERAKRLRRAEELTLEGKLDLARAEMDAVLQLFPDDMETLRKSAELSAELNEADETARRLKSLIDKNAREAAQLQNALYDDLRSAPAFEALYRFAAEALNASEEKGAAALAAEIYEAAGMFNEAHSAYEQIHAGETDGSAPAAYGKSPASTPPKKQAASGRRMAPQSVGRGAGAWRGALYDGRSGNL